MGREHIYLDHAASTPVRPEVVEAMLPFWLEYFGNPSSVHTSGRRANLALEQARQTIAEILHAKHEEIIFTGCGSESDNMALRGVMMAARRADRGGHMITCVIEHKAVLETAYQLRDTYGFESTILPVNQLGMVDPADVKASIRRDTALISIMAANNEIGTLQPILDIGEIAKESGVLFHTDAIQAAVTYEWNMDQMPIDLLSLAPHKFYGPKGIGILFARRGTDLLSTLTGGGQEEGRRAGTSNVPLAVGAAEAYRLAWEGRARDLAHYRRQRDKLISGLLEAFAGGIQLTGHPERRLHNNASFAFQDLSGNDLLMHLDARGVSASSGSACLTGDPQPSKTLEALGLDSHWTRGGLRLTTGRLTTDEHITYTLDVLPEIVDNLSRIRGLYRNSGL